MFPVTLGDLRHCGSVGQRVKETLNIGRSAYWTNFSLVLLFSSSKEARERSSASGQRAHLRGNYIIEGTVGGRTRTPLVQENRDGRRCWSKKEVSSSHIKLVQLEISYFTTTRCTPRFAHQTLHLQTSIARHSLPLFQF